MNAPYPLQRHLQPAPLTAPQKDDGEINVAEHWDIVVDDRWLIAAITAAAAAEEGVYAPWRHSMSSCARKLFNCSGSAKARHRPRSLSPRSHLTSRMQNSLAGLPTGFHAYGNWADTAPIGTSR